MERLVVVGAGGCGRETYALAQEINAARPQWELLGFLDDNAHALDGYSGYGPWLGKIEDYGRLDRPWAVCAMGSSLTRKRVVQSLEPLKPRWATLIHPAAYVAPTARLGEGSIVARGSVISVDAALERHVLVNLLVMVGHDAQVGDYATLSPHACLGGAAVLEEGVFLGLHALVLPQKRLRAWSLLGAGSVAVADGAEQATLFGLPARVLPTRRARG